MRKLIPLFLILTALHNPVNAQCDASFTATANGASVQFVSDTTRNGLLHKWTFGDGAQGFGAVTSHTYGASGVYQVLHTISDSAGLCNDSVFKNVIISFQATCHASFVSQKDSILPNKYNFFSTSVAGGGTIQSYNWTINGNFVSSASSFSRTLAQGLNYVCLTINTTAGCSSTICDSIRVDTSTNCNLNANFTARVSRDTVFLTAVDSTAHLLHHWKFGDGRQDFGREVIHNYFAQGVYQVTHIVRDSANQCVDSTRQFVTIIITPPCRASYVVTRDSTEKKKFNFISTSTVQGGTIISYRWTIDNHVVSSANAFSINLKKGVHVITLDIKTSTGCVTGFLDSLWVDSLRTKDSIPFITSYPNPVPGGPVNLQLTLENNAKVKVTVYNSRGLVVYKQERNYSPGFNMLSIPVDDLQRGHYFIDIQYGNTRKRSVFQKL